MLIADGFASGRAHQTAGEVRRQTVALVEAGLAFVELRDHAASEEIFRAEGKKLVEDIRSIHSGVTLVVNSRRAVAGELGCGLHDGMRGMEGATASLSPFPARSGKRAGEWGHPRGYSAHTPADIQRAADAGFDYATLSPIFPTQTHPEATHVGLDVLMEVRKAVLDFPVFALGGITPQRAQACLHAGAYGVAVLSDLLDADNPGKRLDAYRDAGVL